MVDKLKRKEYRDLPPLALPRLSLRVRDREQLSSFYGLVPAAAGPEDGVLWLVCRAESGVLEAVIGLDLPNELLLFDPERGVAVREGTDPRTITARIDVLQLLKDLLCNGSLEVRSADTDMSLGRTDPYIGHNIDLAGSVTNIDRSIEQLRAQLRDSHCGSASSN
jgi:hypothetical protein